GIEPSAEALLHDRLEHHLRGRGLPGETVDRCRHQRTDIHLLWPDREESPLGPSEDEEVAGEAGEPVRLLERALYRGHELRFGPRTTERELELALEVGQRRAQLVARIVDQAALALDRRLQSLEHPVEAQAERCELVA